MAERKQEEWLGEPMPYLPGNYIYNRSDKGLHQPGDHLKNFDPWNSVYDGEILLTLVTSFIAGYTLAYLIDKYRNKYLINPLGFLN